VLRLDTHRGHPVVISMFYGTCPYACPTLIGDIKRLEKSLDEETRKDLRVILVSFDPERDTPARLAELGQKHGLDATRFELCRASESQVRELAAVLGIQYRKLPGGGFNHSSVITVLDASGNVAGRVDGLERPVAQLVDAVRRARTPSNR
jgi:protein SCO1/2